MTEGRQTFHSSSVLQSMLSRLKSNEKVKLEGLNTSKWYINPKSTDQSVCEVTVDKLESNCPRRDHSETTNDPQSLESAVRNGADEEITRNDTLGTDCQESRSSPSIFPKYERRKYTSNHFHNLMMEEEEDPETNKGQLNYLRSNRYLSVPNSCSMTDMNKADMHFGQANQIPEQTAMLKAVIPEAVDYNGSKTQKKVKTKNITQKLVARLKDKNGQEKKRSSSSNHGDEEEARSVTSMGQAEPPVKLQHSPPSSPREKNSTTVHFKLQRAFTFRDFTLNLEPINLLEEVLTGEEWARFLPAKESPPQAEPKTHLQTESSVQLDDVQSHSLVIKQELSAKKDESHSDVDEISISDTPLDKFSQSRQRQDKPHSAIFAVPKALITNAAIKQRRSELPQYEPSNDDDDVYDFVEVYMLPKEEPLNMSKAKDLPLDVSAVKSLGILDNSALKSRIHLSKKRMHRPPKKRKKEKPEDTQFSKFYTFCTPVDLSHHFSDSTTSSSISSAVASSVFYTNVTNWTQSCD
ncbi:hypothetical protein AOLI_G00019320 [Acnodon oligacanthus]